MNRTFNISMNGDTLGRLFMPRAGTFEVLEASVLQEQFVVDSIHVDGADGRCRLAYSEWEENDSNGAKAGPPGTAMKVATMTAIAAAAAIISRRDAVTRLPRFQANSGPKAMAATSGTMIGAKVALK